MTGIWFVISGALVALLYFGRRLEGATPATLPEPIPERVVVPSTPGAPYPYPVEVRSAATRYKVSADVVAAVVSWEQRSRTKWNPNAVNPADPSYGLGQVTPYIGVKAGQIPSESDYAGLFVPQKNLNAVAWFLHYLLEDMKYPFNDAIQMYNLGETKFAKGLRVPDYLAGVQKFLKEIRGY